MPLLMALFLEINALAIFIFIKPSQLTLTLKQDPLPRGYLFALLEAILLLELLPFLEEFLRGWRRSRRRAPGR